MSKAMRSSGRVGLAALIVTGLVGTLVVVRILALGQSLPPLQLADTNVVDPTFAIGPIDGLTSSWYLAPPVTSIPLGTYVQLHQPASPHSIVKWTGAEEVARDAQGSTAECWLLEPGPHVVRVDVVGPDQGSSGHVEQSSSSCVLNVVNIPLDQITVSVAEVWVDPVAIDESLPQDQLNELTMDYFFGLSIAALHDLGNGRYRTSVDRLVHMTVAVDPPGFAPLMEWRFDGAAREIGASTTTWFTDIGNHVAEVGPLLNPAEIEIETYSVTITSHISGEDIIPEGEPVLFEAVTDPPGYENEIAWLSSTMYGTAEPILSEGPVFIAEFNDTWGPWPEDPSVLFQWLGVKADNAAFNQDQKPILLEFCDGFCGEPAEGYCFVLINIKSGDANNDLICDQDSNIKENNVICIVPCPPCPLTEQYQVVGTNCTFEGITDMKDSCAVCNTLPKYRRVP